MCVYQSLNDSPSFIICLYKLCSWRSFRWNSEAFLYKNLATLSKLLFIARRKISLVPRVSFVCGAFQLSPVFALETRFLDNFSLLACSRAYLLFIDDHHHHHFRSPHSRASCASNIDFC